MTIQREKVIKDIVDLTPKLRDGQLVWLRRLTKIFHCPMECKLNESSDILNKEVADYFGNALMFHHCFSVESFSKDKFEYVLEQSFTQNNKNAKRAPKGNPGHDINIEEAKFSLKTQADRNIKIGIVHISKFMELGKGDWSDNPEDLNGLRDQFFAHMKSYERILTLRNLRAGHGWHYELVEIPKSLLLEAADGEMEMKIDSKQFPKPGYCRVYDSNKNLSFALYFDGGTERKLQIKSLRKSLCRVHCEWFFSFG